MSAKCPKASFMLLSVSRERGLPRFPWSNRNVPPTKFFEEANLSTFLLPEPEEEEDQNDHCND